MKQKELRRLSKAELIDIIYEQKKIEVSLKNKLAEAQQQLEEHDIQVKKAGTLAEAALSVNKVFEAAQRAADDYVRQIHVDYSAIERNCNDLLAQTEAKCRTREAEADRRINERWGEFQQKAQEYLRSRAELLSLLPQDNTNDQ